MWEVARRLWGLLWVPLRDFNRAAEGCRGLETASFCQALADVALLGCVAPIQIPSGQNDSRFANRPSKESGIIEETKHGPHASTR